MRGGGEVEVGERGGGGGARAGGGGSMRRRNIMSQLHQTAINARPNCSPTSRSKWLAVHIGFYSTGKGVATRRRKRKQLQEPQGEQCCALMGYSWVNMT